MADEKSSCRVSTWLRVAFGYATMSFPDVLGVVAERLRLADFASVAVFAWFALVSLPSGVVCGRIGSRKAAVLAMGATTLAVALLAFSGERSAMAVAGLALAGAANVLLQVAMPTHVAESFGAEVQAGVLTLGQVVKSFTAILLPFVLAGCASAGNWRLFFLVFGAMTLVAVLPMAFSGGGGSRLMSRRTSLASVLRLLGDRPTALVAAVFAIAIMSDVAFNLSIPNAVRGRFMSGDSTIGVVYAVLFGIKLPVMFAGAWLFSRYGTARFFVPSLAVALAGAATLLFAENFTVYIAGVVLFAGGYANLYGFVFGAASPRHPPECAAEVSSLMVMAIAGGALASPALVAFGAFGDNGAEKLVLASAMTILFLAVAVSRSRSAA